MSNPHPSDHPLVKAADIQARLKQATPLAHWANPDASRRAVCMSDMVGLNKDLGVHLVRLDPGKSGSEMHHHYCDSEWFYILRGSGKLLLTPCTMAEGAGTSGMTNLATACPVEENNVGAGDFAGFPGGPGGTGPTAVGPNGVPYAHTFVAGPDCLEYLCGGTRKPFDVCIYPLKQKTLLRDEGGARSVADYDAFEDAPLRK